MNSSLKIVPFNATLHTAGLLRLYEEAFTRPSVNTAFSTNTTRQSDDSAELLQQIKKASGFVYVAEGVGVVAGISIFDHPTRKDVCIVANLVTDARYRRRGVASALLREAVRWARGQHLAHIALQVEATNEAALGLYHSFNFSRMGEVAYLTFTSLRLTTAHTPCHLRAANANDVAVLRKLVQINIPKSLGQAQPDWVEVESAATWWIGETDGKLVGAARVQTASTVQIELMLDPKASVDAGQAFLMGLLQSIQVSNASSITARQSAHTLMNLRVMRVCGFEETRRMIHLAITV